MAVTVLEDGQNDVICRDCINNMIHFKTTLVNFTAFDQTTENLENQHLRHSMDTSVDNNSGLSKQDTDDLFTKHFKTLNGNLDKKFMMFDKKLTTLESKMSTF